MIAVYGKKIYFFKILRKQENSVNTIKLNMLLSQVYFLALEYLSFFNKINEMIERILLKNWSL